MTKKITFYCLLYNKIQIYNLSINLAKDKIKFINKNNFISFFKKNFKKYK